MSRASQVNESTGRYDLVIDEYSETATYIHEHTGIRVQCDKLHETWHLKLLPPVKMGDSRLASLGFGTDREDAEHKAKQWLADHPNGVPDTYAMHSGVRR